MSPSFHAFAYASALMRVRAWASVRSIFSRSACLAGAPILWRIAAAALASTTAASSRDWQLAHQDNDSS